MSQAAEGASITEQCLQSTVADHEATTVMNMTLMDPPRYGWPAIGSIADLLPPHERARRKSTRLSFRKQKRRSLATRIELPPKAAVGSTSKVYAEVSNDNNSDPPLQQPSDKCSDSVEVQTPGKSKGLDESIVASAETSSTKPQVETGETEKSGEGSSSDDKTQLKRVPQHHLKQSSDISDQLVENLGYPMPFLGLSNTTKKNPDKDSTEANCRSVEELMSELEVEATKDGILDMYSYHRGREGMEPRDPDNGELLCDVKQTDTSHGWEAQRTTATIIIEFPLEEEDIANLQNGSKRRDSASIARYRESIQWDLSDASCPAPMTYATNIAEEFGLTSGQTIDLATSIQKQLDSHVAQHCAFYDPVSAKDPIGNDRNITYTPRLTHRYGSTLDSELEGMQLSKTEIVERQQRWSRHGSPKGFTGTNSNSRRKNTNRPPPVHKTVVYQVDDDEEEIEEKYVTEVRKRARAASELDCLEKSDSGVLGPLEKKSDFHCHICHKRCNNCFLFPCGHSSHSYCFNHCKQRLGLSLDSGEIPILDYCPICSVACKCSKCTRKAEAIARALKSAVEDQGTTLESTQFDGILKRCAVNVQPKTQRIVQIVEESQSFDSEDLTPEQAAENMPTANLKLPRRSSGARIDDKNRPMVPKPPLSEFPREVCGAKELEPGTTDDFMTIYTSDGKYVCESLPEIMTVQDNSTTSEKKSNDGEVVEDGNVDYCHVCKNHGNLLCCDFCPRAFHSECIEGEDQPSGEKWECHVCRMEKMGTEDDVADGKGSLDLICGAFFETEVDTEALEKMRLLSMIHEMVKKLIDYDFGYMFGEPVDLEKVPGYKTLVKNPMDLGTIGSRLISGEYSRRLKSGQSWDELVGSILKDVELVWHNCFTFNYEGSAIYRMADVHRRKAHSIRKKSFDHLLNEQVKAEIDEYVLSCEQARGRYRASSSPLNSNRRQTGKHKISVSRPKGGITRPVAVLNPSSSRVVIVYSTMKSACQAAQALLNLGHNCEWHSINELHVKAIIHRSLEDPSILLFGHRWLVLDDLRNGRVTFSTSSTDIVEMKHDTNSHVFLSIDEALSFPELPRSIPLDKLRKELSSVPCGDDWTEICGRSWRRPRMTSIGADENKNPDDRASASDVTTHLHQDARFDQSYMMENSDFAKEDLVSGRRLIGFNSIQAAFDDWVLTCECSPAFPDDETTTIEHFRSFYLDGDRNVDGIVWRTLTGSTPEKSMADRSRGCESENFAEASAGIPSESPQDDTKVRTSGHELSAGSTDSLQEIGKERQCVAPIENCEESSLGKRKRVSLDTDLGTPVRHLSKTDCSGSPENKKLQNGTSHKKGQFLEGLHGSAEDGKSTGGVAPNYVSF